MRKPYITRCNQCGTTLNDQEIAGQNHLCDDCVEERMKLFIEQNTGDTTTITIPSSPSVFDKHIAAIHIERQRQDAKWGKQDHDDLKWAAILQEEVGEITKAIIEGNQQGLAEELTQAAAVIAAWVEARERRSDA